ncbi:MAG: Flp pilus assembly complex ATPase component TadA [Candidatus Omnitrophica bacterium]|nr:Flp pilus assembly complex ATPase component TadA [Candidatus Omnitrophota bacterium]
MIRKKKTYIIGEELLKRDFVTLEQLDHALDVQKDTNEFLGEILIRFGYISEAKLLDVLADQFELPLVDPAKLSVPKNLIERVPSKISRYYHAFPIKWEHNKLLLAMNAPPEFNELQELSAILGSEIQVVLAERSKIDEAIQKHYGIGASIVDQLSRPSAAAELSPHETHVEEMEAAIGEASIRELVNQLLVDAQKKRASDIHMEPFPNRLRVRYRIDGILEETSVPEKLKRFHPNIISRIKIMANLDLSEHRLPQDGRIKIRIQNEELDLRISLLPTPYGESLVIRLLSPTHLLQLDRIGLSENHLKELRTVLKKPSGIVLLTGPTGSGKTTTLYACLSELNSVGRKIITVEDPIEYQLEGMIQMQVQPKINLTFARGLRHMLRHDPNVMMVGEIRDLETAEIAVRSSMTGHLVFSTLHTNDAPSAVARLIDLGIPPYLLSSSLECVIAQRLVRLICEKCKVKQNKEFMGAGCEACNGTGFFGRSAVHEFLLLDPELKALLAKRVPTSELREAAIKKGMLALRDDGLAKVNAGITTESEVLRVT